jgi:hypothetical protein
MKTIKNDLVQGVIMALVLALITIGTAKAGKLFATCTHTSYRDGEIVMKFLTDKCPKPANANVVTVFKGGKMINAGCWNLNAEGSMLRYALTESDDAPATVYELAPSELQLEPEYLPPKPVAQPVKPLVKPRKINNYNSLPVAGIAIHNNFGTMLFLDKKCFDVSSKEADGTYTLVPGWSAIVTEKYISGGIGYLPAGCWKQGNGGFIYVDGLSVEKRDFSHTAFIPNDELIRQ